MPLSKFNQVAIAGAAAASGPFLSQFAVTALGLNQGEDFGNTMYNLMFLAINRIC